MQPGMSERERQGGQGDEQEEGEGDVGSCEVLPGQHQRIVRVGRK